MVLDHAAMGSTRRVSWEIGVLLCLFFVFLKKKKLINSLLRSIVDLENIAIAPDSPVRWIRGDFRWAENRMWW